MKMISLVDADDPEAENRMRRGCKIESVLSAAGSGLEHGSANQTLRESDFVSEFGEDAFKEAVERIKSTRGLAT